MKSFLVGLIAGMSMALAASSAIAVPTATIDTTPDFATLAGYSTSTAGGTLNVAPTFNASDLNVVRSPFEGTGSPAAGFFASGPLEETNPNPAVLTFATAVTSLSFLWGSPDTYNIITFYNGGSPIGTLADFLGVVPGLYTGAGAVFVSVTDILFDRVEFFSNGQQALEFASLSTIPVPAGLPLLGAGVALLGYLGMRRKRNAAAA